MKAAVLSDTHDLLREEALSRIRECDDVIHAGDFCARTIMEQIIENIYNIPEDTQGEIMEKGEADN